MTTMPEALPKTSAATGWSTRTVRDSGEFSALEQPWKDLYARCSAATPFQSHAWLDSWWRSYGEDSHLCVVLVHRAGRLVAAAPLRRQRRWGLAVLAPIGGALSDLTDVLLDDGCAGEAAPMLAAALAREAGAAVVDLPEVPPGAAAWRLCDAWPAATRVTPASICLELPGVSLKELTATLPKERARNVKRKLRKIDSVGIISRPAPPERTAEVVQTLVDLHRAQWSGRGINPEHLQPRFTAHLSRALTRMVRDDQALLLEFVWQDRVVAVELLLVGHDFVGAYLFGHDPHLRTMVDLKTMLAREDLASTVRLGRATFSTLRGTEDYKQQLNPKQVRNQRVLLGGTGRLRTRAYFAAVAGRGRLATGVKQRLPMVHRLLRRGRQLVSGATGGAGR